MAGQNNPFGRLFSTQFGELCGRCERPVKECTCRRAGSGREAGDGPARVRVGRETKGRRGGTGGVTVVTGVPLADAELRKLGKELKKKCGTGGAVKDGVIELQGDHRDAVVRLLDGRGWDVRRAGG